MKDRFFPGAFGKEGSPAAPLISAQQDGADPSPQICKVARLVFTATKLKTK